MKKNESKNKRSKKKWRVGYALISFLKKIRIKLLGLRVYFKRKFNRGETNTVFLVKWDGIGDFVLFLPIAEELRRLYNDKKLIIACDKHVEYLALECGFFDEVISFDRDDFSFGRIKKTYKSVISKIKCDILLHPTQPRSLSAEILAYLTNAKTKIASLGEVGAISVKLKAKCDKTYDRLIDTGERNMTMIQNASFIRALGAEDFLVTMPKFRSVRESYIPLPENYFVVFLGGSIFNKLWPAEKFLEVARHIIKETGWVPLLCGLKTDMDQERVFAEAGDIDYYSLVGKTSMCDLIYVISRAKMVIGNDTCAIHIANAVRVPSVCVRGQFSGEKFFPYVVEKSLSDDMYPTHVCADAHCKWCTLRGGGFFCLHGDYYAKKKVKCLMRVSVDDVIKASDATIDKYYRINNN